MNWIQRLLARMGVPVGASLAVDIATVDTVVDAIKIITDAIPDAGALTTLQAAVDAIKAITDVLPDAGALTTIQADLDNADQYKADLTTLETRLSAARALLLDEITALRMAELDAANIPADIDTLLTRITAAVALEATLDTHDTDIKALLTTIAGYLDTEIDAIKTQTDKIAGKMLFSMDFWSNPQEEIQVPAVAATLVITPTVSVADLPVGATIVRAIGMFKFRMVQNTYDGANALDGATDPDTTQVIQVKETAAGAYIDAINFADDQFTFTELSREGGDVFIGQVDIAGQVDANDSYTFQWKMRKSDGDFIIFNDIQMGIRIWYSV